MNIFTLMGTIMVDSDKANRSIQKTDSKIEKLAKGFKSGVGTAAKWGAGIAAGASVAIGALVATGAKFADTTDRVDKFSQKMNLSREGFQEWEFILSQSGSSIDSMQSGLSKLAVSVDDLKTGTGAGAAAFERLGISIEDVKGKSQEEIFEMTITALQGVTDESERAAIAKDLLGKASSELAPVFNTTGEAIEDMRGKAHELGLVMGDETIDAGVKLQDTMDQAKRAFGAVGIALAESFMPILQDMLDWIVAHMPEIQQFIKDAFENARIAVDALYMLFKENVLPILETLYNYLQEHMPEIKAFIKTAFDGAKAAVEALYTVFNESILPVLKKLYSYIEKHMPLIKDLVSKAFNLALKAVKGFWGFLDAYVLPILEKLGNFIAETVIPIIAKFVGFFLENIPKAVDGVKSTFEKLGKFFEDVGEAISDVVDWINDAIDALKTFLAFDGQSVDVTVNKTVVEHRTKKSPASTGKTGNPNRPHGHHALGLNYVPFDGYIAELHKGERVLTKQENAEINNNNDEVVTVLKSVLNELVKMNDDMRDKFKNALETADTGVSKRDLRRLVGA